MKMKRIIAFALALCMLGSSLLTGVSNEVTYAYEKQQVLGSYVIDRNELVGKQDEESEDVTINKVSKEEASELVEEETGIMSGEEAMQTLDKLPEGSDVAGGTSVEIGATFEKIENDIDITVGGESAGILSESKLKEDDVVKVIILFENDAVIDANPDAEMNFFTKIQISVMELVQNYIISRIEKKALDGSDLEIKYQYTWLLNGIATEVPYGVIDEIEKIKGVSDVIIQTVYDVCDVDTVDPNSIVNGGMVGRDETWASGYTGEGVKIAIIDTGIDEDHQNFQAMESDKLTEDSATKSTISAVVDQLNASKEMSNLTAEKLYLSNKIAYAFNYADGNLKINHSSDDKGDHGTHVAGIAAANDLKNDQAVGVAPDAQLYVMKVFGADHDGATTEDLLAAVEDAMILGADVINMSVGSPAGFASENAKVDAIYEKIATTGIVLAVSAGNSSTSGLYNAWGTNANLTSNPDNATVAAPGTYTNATTVASVENIAFYSIYFEVLGEKYTYLEADGGPNASIETITEQEYEYVMIPNYGQTLEDFTSVNCEGKIAVVQRGMTAFYQKCQLAQDAGAVACIIYNNQAGEIGLNMTGGTSTIPCVSVTMQVGERLAAALEENAKATIKFAEDVALIDSQTAYEMSNFSSWGVSPNLGLEPDITAPGGDIYSTLDDGKYGLMSGTSMSSPNVAGLAALLTQYVKENFKDLTATESRTLINALLMSTATPLESDGISYSPRLQGAGLANAYLAINSNAHLSVDGMDLPKVELYDDPAKTGKYAYTFNVKNFGDSDIYYHVDTNVQTEGVTTMDGLNFMSSTPVVLDAVTSESSDAMVKTYDYTGDQKANVLDAYELYKNVLSDTSVSDTDFFRYNVDGDEDKDKDDVQAYLNALVGKTDSADLNDTVLEVKAGKTAKVSVNVNVTEAGKTYMDTNYENGVYVEGFTVLTAMSAGEINLSLPYMGFYGDWTEAPAIDSDFYWESAEEMDGSTSETYPNVLWTQFGAQSWYPGMNPYLGAAYGLYDLFTFSPNGDGYGEYIEEIYVGLLRNAKTLTFTYTAEDGTVLYEAVSKNVEKSVYNEGYGIILPYVYGWDHKTSFDMRDAEGAPLPNNTKLTLTIKANLDYDKHEQSNDSDEWVVPIMIDTEAPVLSDVKVKVETDANGVTKQYAYLLFDDNHATAAVNFLTKSGASVLAQHPVDHNLEGKEYQVYDITGFGNEFQVILGDYAFNESAYVIETDDNDPVIDDSLLFGYRVYDGQIADDSLFGWVGINPESAALEVYSSEAYMDYALVAAEYVGGYIIGVDANDDLVAIKPGYWDERIVITNLYSTVRDMTYDPTTNTIYVLYKYNYDIAAIDLDTIADGEFVELESATAYPLTHARTLTCDDDGQLYIINTTGQLQKLTLVYNEDEGAYTYETTTIAELCAGTDYKLSALQSMTYDSNADCIYWASFLNDSEGAVKGNLVKINVNADKTSATSTVVGQIGGPSEIVGLLSMDDNTYDYRIPTNESVSEIYFEERGLTMLTGDTYTLDYLKYPWYGTAGEEVWTSSDESVVTVNNRGVIKAVATGTATITVAFENSSVQTSIVVNVVKPSATIHAFAATGVNSLDNQWVTFDADKMHKFDVHTQTIFSMYTAGEYVDGTIYAYGQDSAFYKIDPTTYKATLVRNGRSDYQVMDMAYDYITGYMYAIIGDGRFTYLAHVDMLTGELEKLGSMVDEYENGMCALAVGTDGTIYTISMGGYLNTVTYAYSRLHRDYVCYVEKVGHTGYTGSEYPQSMTYDHNDGGLYWAMVSANTELSMMYIDPVTATTLPIGSIDGGAQLTAMHIIPDENKIPERDYVPVEGINVNAANDSVAVMVGASTLLPVQVTPLNATNRVIDWEIEDESIATIEDGVVTGVAEGTTYAIGMLEDGEETYDVALEINVIQSAGELRGFLLTDLASPMEFDFWISIDDTDLSTGTALTEMQDYTLYAGEYYNGKIYGYGVRVTEDDEEQDVFIVLNVVKNADGEDTYVVESITPGDYPIVVDMAFDYSEGVMYAVTTTLNVEGQSALNCVDIKTGELYKVGDMICTDGETEEQIMTLACTTDGQLYGASYGMMNEDEGFVMGCIYPINKYTATLDDMNAIYTDVMADVYQSMAYDHNTGNIYWAQIDYNYTGVTNLYLVDIKKYEETDPDTGETFSWTEGSLVSLGHIGAMGAQVSALHTIPKTSIEVGTPANVTLALNETEVKLNKGDTFAIKPTMLPLNVNATGTYTFASADATIATVDANGVVTAVAGGTVDITVTAANGTTATCTVTVMDDSLKVHVIGKNGYQIAPLYNDTTIDSSVYPENLPFEMSMVTYADGWYYALDTTNVVPAEGFDVPDYAHSSGYLWRFKEGFTDLEKVGGQTAVPLYTLCTPDGEPTDTIIDIFTNEFTGQVYVLARMPFGMDGEYDYFYTLHELSFDEVNNTCEVEFAAYLEAGFFGGIKSPQKAEFISADTLVVWDHMDDYVYTAVYSEEDETYLASQLLYGQQALYSDYNMGMAYNKDLNLVFIAGKDDYADDGRISLYVIDPVKRTIKKHSEKVNYDRNLVELIFAPTANVEETN